MLDEVRVLVVDDVQDAAEMMASALTLDGFRAITASGGQEALNLIDQYKPHVVLIDVVMPDMDGCELSQRLRKQYGDEIILIAVTGHDTDDLRVSNTFECVDHYFHKPVDLSALRKVLTMA